MITVQSICDYLEALAPKPLQESYDNSGLLTGSPSLQLTGALICLDCTEDVVEEAIEKNANLIIAHHPIIFSGLKSLTGKNYVERTIIKAIQNNVAIYAIHTNLDNVAHGVNYKLAEKLGLVNNRILRPMSNLQKLVTFIPVRNTEDVLKQLHDVGAGKVGNYSQCSFRVLGKGSFKANNEAKPVIGEVNHLEEVEENRIELIYPGHLSAAIITTLKAVHPYEEVAHYITNLENENQESGAGMIGELPKAMVVMDFLKHLKESLSLSCIKHTDYDKEIKKVAICGGSGSFLLKDAIKQGADAFVTGDVKYHEFFDAEASLMFCDIGHYESEVETKELLYEMLTKKFTNFALYLSRTVTNPVKYFT